MIHKTTWYRSWLFSISCGFQISNFFVSYFFCFLIYFGDLCFWSGFQNWRQRPFCRDQKSPRVTPAWWSRQTVAHYFICLDNIWGARNHQHRYYRCSRRCCCCRHHRHHQPRHLIAHDKLRFDMQKTLQIEITLYPHFDSCYLIHFHKVKKPIIGSLHLQHLIQIRSRWSSTRRSIAKWPEFCRHTLVYNALLAVFDSPLVWMICQFNQIIQPLCYLLNNMYAAALFS